MLASNDSGMPTQLRRNAQHLRTIDSFCNGNLACTSLVSAEQKYTQSNECLGDNSLSLHQQKSPSQSILAMLFSTKEIKPNILSSQFARPGNADVATMPQGLDDDGHTLQNPGKQKPLPQLPTLCDGYFDLNTFSSEVCSFATNPNDINSLTSSDWGDEVCEVDRRRSQHVKELFNAIDQLLYEPGCLKNHIPSTQIRRSSELQSGLYESSNQLASSDFASVKHLIPECEEWVAKFPHFRLDGVQIRPLPVNSRGQPQQWLVTATQQCRLSDHHLNAPPPTNRRFIRLPGTSRVSRTPLDLQNASRLYLPGSPLVIQGQRIQTLPSVNTTTWLNRSRVSRVASRTQIGAANARSPHPSNNKTFLSTLPENPLATASHEALAEVTNESKRSLYSIRQWESQTVKAPENRVMMQSPQCAVYMGSRTAKSRDGLVRKEALTQALVVIVLNEALAVLEMPGAVEKLDDIPTATAKLTKSHLTPNSKEFDNVRGTRMALSPDPASSTKTRSPSRLQDRKSPVCPMNFVLSGKSFTSTSDLSSLATTVPVFLISTKKKNNAKFSITWPTRPDAKISPKPHLGSTRTSPIPSGRSNTSCGRNTLQTGSTLPPITINRKNPQVAPRQFRRSGNETPRLPSIFSTAANHPDGEDNGTNYHYSAKVSLHGGSNQTAVLEHLSHLREPLNKEGPPHHEMNVRRNHSCVTKFAPYPSKAAQIQCSVEISSQKHQPADSI